MRFIAYMIYPLILFGIFITLYATNLKVRVILRDNLFFILGSFIIAFVFGNAFIYLFLRTEKFIYFWDYSAFWKSSLLLNQALKSNAIDALKSVYTSMNNEEYTMLPSLFISLPTTVLGTSFLAYVLSIFNTIVLPLILMTQVLFYLVVDRFSIPLKKHIRITISALSICFLPWYFTLITGYIGVIGQLFIVIIFVILVSKKLEELELSDIIIINLLNFLLVFSRRWYLFWVITFYLVTGLVHIISQYKNRQLLKALLRIITLGIGLLLATIVFFRPYLLRLFDNTYQDQYTAFQDSSDFVFLLKIFWYYGVILLLPVLFGLIKLLRIKNYDDFVVVISLQTIIVSLMFLQIQGFDWHHFNLINVQVMILSFIGIIFIIKTKKVLAYVYSILLLVNLIYVFTPRYEVIDPFTNLLLANVNRVPRIRTDIEEVQDLAIYLNTLTIDGKYAYVAASSHTLNDDLLRNSQLPWIINSVPNLDASSNIDRRDGFPKDFFNINYVVTTSPTQYHMPNPNDQYIVRLINESIQTENLFKDNFVVIYDKYLSNIHIRIFERITDYSVEEKLYFYNKLAKQYPNDPNLYDFIIK